ncbi:MAG: hypothetical protein ACYCPP_05110 [Nitrososphaerales archaeon]
MEGSVFVLSGEDLTFPSAEIFALVETYSKENTCQKLSQRVVVSKLEDLGIISRISERAAYCRFGGGLVSIASHAEDLAKELDASILAEGISFAVKSESLDNEVCGDIGGQIKEKSHARVSLEEPDCVFQVERLDDGRFVLGVSSRGVKTFSWKHRRPRARKFFLPSAIYPKLARLLVNLSRVREEEYFLDPFCGTGSLLIESSVMGIKTIGFDLTRWIAKGSRLNLQGFSLDFESIIRADSTHSPFPLNRVDAIATDVPYGRASSTKGKDTAQIIRELVVAAADSLNSDKYCVVMHPSHVDLDCGNSFRLSEQHLLYVHRNLTRAISVLRRK